jgi:hypothetical protein
MKTTLKDYVQFAKLYSINRILNFTVRLLSFFKRGTFKIDDLRKEYYLRKEKEINLV